jgi:hypothetical protein
MILIIIGAVVALIVGVLLAVTTFNVAVADRAPGEPAFRLVFTVVWPSGPVTYSWPKAKR